MRGDDRPQIVAVARPYSTSAQVRQPNAAVNAIARATFQRTQLASNCARTAARSAACVGSPAAASASLSGTFTTIVITNATADRMNAATIQSSTGRLPAAA